MKDFYNSYTFILSFLALELAISMMFGEKFTEAFLWLVLLSMVLINSQTFIDFFNNTFFEVKKG